jgi:hypothetical protein
MLAASVAILPLIGGCDSGAGDKANPPEAVAGPPAGPGGPGPGGPGGPGGLEEGWKSSPEIKQIMKKLGMGPRALTGAIGTALKADTPAWDAIQAQTKDYAQSAAELAKYEPTKGSKESWEKQVAAFSSAAADLDKAAQAKDKDAALAAHKALNTSCMNCHREHRTMGPGMGGGGMRGPGGPGGFRGGPPPGGPGGPPPGGPGGPPPGGPDGPLPGGPPPDGPPPGGEPPK